MSSNTSDDRTADWELPAGWRVEQPGSQSVVFGYGSHLEVEINPRYHTSRARENRSPDVFQVRVRNRHFNHAMADDATVLGSPSSFATARELAYEYMTEFVTDRQRASMETRADLEADPVMAADAEEAIVTEAASEAAVAVAGYSDTLLVTELKGVLESADANQLPVLQAVVHRDDGAYDVVYIADDCDHLGDPGRLREFSREFEWLNDQKLASSIDAGALSVMIAKFDDTRLIRYVVNEHQETLVLIDPDYPVHLPPFERQIKTIVDAKWN